MLLSQAAEEPRRPKTRCHRGDGTDPNGGKDIKGGGAACRRAKRGDRGGEKLDRGRVQDHQQAKLVAGDTAAAHRHFAGGPDAEGGGCVAKPQEIC